MNFFSALTEQLGLFFNSQSTARRLMLLLVIAGSIGGLGWLMLRASSGGYVPVLSGVERSTAGSALAKLSQQHIPAKLDDTGTSVLVGRNNSDQAVILLAEEGILGPGTVGSELLDRNSFGDSNFKQQKNYLRMREGEMARTLMSLGEVEFARVHLALPDDQVFAKEQEAAKASVVLRLRAGAQLSERQINGIVNLVSHGVEGLLPENVSIIDSQGNMLNRNRPSDFSNVTAENLSYKTQAEERIRAQVEKMLERTVGKDHVIASVQMDYDFSTQKSVQTLFNPKEQDPILQTETVNTEQQSNGITAPAASDPSGGSAASLPQPAMPGTLRNESTRNYAVSQQVQETSLNVPLLKRVTVGVMVDGTYDETKGADGKVKRDFKPRPDDEMAKLLSVVKATIGFDDQTRQDIVEVSCVPFQNEELDLPAKTFLTPEIRHMVEIGIQWGVVGVIGLLLILLVLKPAVKQISVAAVTRTNSLPGGLGGLSLPNGGEGFSEEDLARYAAAAGNSRDLQQLQQNNRATADSSQKMFREIQEEAKTNPEKTVGMIRQWMEEG